MLEQVTAYFRRWIGILRLGDENEIALRLIRGKPDLGECFNDPRYGRAYIELRDPSDGTHPDWKRSTIHELLHVRIPIAAPENSPLRGAIEHSVEIMSRILFDLDSAGSTPETMYRKAHTWARTIQAAHGGQKRMKKMADPAALAALAMDAGAAIAADPPDVAAMTELLKKLIALAAGGDAEVADPEMGKDPAAGADPLLVTDPKDPAAAMYRAALGDDGWKQFQTNAQEMARGQIVSMARTAFGDKLLPAHEAELAKMTPREAAIWIKGRKSAPSAPVPDAASMKRQDLRAPADAKDGAPILAPGEDAAKVHPAILAARANQAEQFGRDTVVAALAHRRVN